jgi:galactokinase
LDCQDNSVEQVPFDLESAGYVLLVIDTKAEHELSDGQYGARRADCEQACRELGVRNLRMVAPTALEAALAVLSHDRLRMRVRHVVTEINRVKQAVAAVREGDLVGLGQLFVASHESLRTDYEVSCSELDVSVQAALDAGALGARMTGGGFGGSSIAVVRRQDVEEVSAAVSCEFARSGFAPLPEFLVAVASTGAGAVALNRLNGGGSW